MGNTISNFISPFLWVEKMKEIHVGSAAFGAAMRAVAHTAQAAKEHLEKDSLGEEATAAWLHELIDRNLLENYKEAGQHLIEIVNNEDCTPENKRAILTSIINNCISNQIEHALEMRRPTLHRDLTGYSATIFNDQQKAKIRTLKEKRVRLYDTTANLCQDLGMEAKAIEINAQKDTLNYLIKIEELAKNIYLKKVENILTELEKYLADNNIIYEDIKQDEFQFKEKLKNYTFEHLDNYQKKVIDHITIIIKERKQKENDPIQTNTIWTQ